MRGLGTKPLAFPWRYTPGNPRPHGLSVCWFLLQIHRLRSLLWQLREVHLCQPQKQQQQQKWFNPFTARVFDGVFQGGFNFWVCGRNHMMWPFKWKLSTCTYTWYYLFFKTVQNEIRKSGRNLPLATFGSERVNRLILNELSLKTDNISRRHRWFPCEMTYEEPAQKFRAAG